MCVIMLTAKSCMYVCDCAGGRENDGTVLVGESESSFS